MFVTAPILAVGLAAAREFVGHDGGMPFVDITAVPVPVDGKGSYVEFSRRMAEVYLDHGATRVTDYWQASGRQDSDDFHADGAGHGQQGLPDFSDVTKASEFEAVVITVTQWPSRQARDSGTVAATKDPRVLATLDEDPVFDGSRLVANSFEVIMDLGS